MSHSDVSRNAKRECTDDSVKTARRSEAPAS
jgi:hypothetical protein